MMTPIFSFMVQFLQNHFCDAQAVGRGTHDAAADGLTRQLISSLLCNCDGGVRFGVVSVSPVPAESRLKSGFFARKALRDGLF